MKPNGQTETQEGRWIGLHKGHKTRPLEWLAEKTIYLVSGTAILTIFLIFLFIGKEALPLIFAKSSPPKPSSTQTEVPPTKLSTEGLAAYLKVPVETLKSKDEKTQKLISDLVEQERSKPNKDKDAGLNTATWRYILFPHQWTDYDKEAYIWQPTSKVAKFNIVPLLVGSLKISLIALAFGVPLALGAAIYVSQLATPRQRELIKPAIELLAGIPSVVLGFFALIVMATTLQEVFGYYSRLNALLAGIALGLAVIPVVFSIAEDALTSVPRAYTQAAFALGASKWQAAWQIVLPAALPGVFAAVVLGFGRAIGETMIVLMASGNASIMSADILVSARTITATIASELAETVFGGTHYRMLFLIGLLLFVVTFLANLTGEMVIQRLKSKLEGTAQ